MRWSFLLYPILVLSLRTAAAQDAANADDVLAAIATDAGAPHPAPETTPDAAPPLTASPAAATRELAATPAAPSEAVIADCLIGHGEHWQQQPGLTLEQCADALAANHGPYDAHGLRHAAWRGVSLSASSKAIYRSEHGAMWTELRKLDRE